MVNRDAEWMIEAEGLSKYYGPFVAIEDVSFKIPKGEVVAFLGPNGAGKSTTMKILTGFLRPSSGTARIAGFDVATDRLRASVTIGYLPENGPLYPEMTPHEFLRFAADIRQLTPELRKQRMEYVAEHCGLRGVWNKPIFKLSRGYRQRVGMAQALLHDPSVLILDEPTSGLDPNQVFEVRQLLLNLGKTKTIMLSTHILQEVRAVASRVLLVHEGRLVYDGPTAQFQGAAPDLDARFRELTGAAV
jgi:ABC-2 type transport system ATP-binding protein